MMVRIIPVVLLFCLLGADQPEKPKLSAVWLHEQRNKFLAKESSIGGYERLAVNLRLDGIKDVRSYGNLKVTEAKTDTGADLIRREKDQGSFFGITNVPSFDVVRDYQSKSGKVEVEIMLHRTPRAAKKVSLKGGLDVLTGGQPMHVDFANFRDTEALKDDALTAAGLKITTNKDVKNTDTQLSYSIAGDNSTLLEISLVDASGTKIKTSGGYYYSRGSYQRFPLRRNSLSDKDLFVHYFANIQDRFSVVIRRKFLFHGGKASRITGYQLVKANSFAKGT